MTPAEVAVALLGEPLTPAALATRVASVVEAARVECVVAGVEVSRGESGGEPVVAEREGVTIRAWAPSADVSYVADVAAAAVPVSLELARRASTNDTMRHETRTWLGIGTGYVALLRDHLDALTPEQRDLALAGLSGSFDKLDRFLRQSLLAEKLATRDPDVHCTETSVEEVIEALRAAYPDVTFELNDVAEPLWVDPVAVRDLVECLVANGARVRLSGSLRIDVTGGPRGRPLTQVRRLAEAHGGTVRVEGEAVVLEIDATRMSS